MGQKMVIFVVAGHFPGFVVAGPAVVLQSSVVLYQSSEDK